MNPRLPRPVRHRVRQVARSVRSLTLLVALTLVSAACGGGESDADGDSETTPTGPTIPANVTMILDASARAMGEVTSVRFELVREGAPAYIDQFQSISIDAILGEFTVPHSAKAALDVEVNDSLKTQLGAIALDDEIWLSNPITGEFETLPAGYDLDPSAFFDPTDGWRPLMAGLTDTTLISLDDRGGQRYHVQGTATRDLMTIITAGLVRNQDVEIDFWIDPVTALVRSAEFSTDAPGNAGQIDWTLELSRYGAEFTIVPPEQLER